jgi:excinuclease ABC subunit C
MANLEAKLANLPTDPGVYFYKNAKGKIIYVGKAAVLKNRVKSYFQKSTVHGPKNQVLMTEIADVDWITVGSEVEALFLESEFIKRYKPKFNVDLRDEKNFIYLKITMNEAYPVVSYVRRPLDDGATYFGPFTASDAVRKAMKMLRRVFPYVTHETMPPRACLQVHLGLCPGPEAGLITSTEYKKNLKRLMMYIRGEQPKLLTQLTKEMEKAAKRKDFEAAAGARDQLRWLQALGKQMIFGERESFDLAKDQALAGLAERLGIPVPRRIEAYDISHIQGTDNVASMVVFTDGVANKEEYRRFQMKLKGNDDFAHMREVISRRFSKVAEKGWAKPDLLLIDGGKGQLAAALAVLEEKGISIPAIGLAKREEQIIRRRTDLPLQGGTTRQSDQGDSGAITRDDSTGYQWNEGDFEIILLPKSSAVIQLLQRIRDEAHRFAVTYHSLLRGKRQTRSLLDEIPGIGPVTRKKLIKVFGSGRAVKEATHDQLSAAVGAAKADVIREHLG